MKLEKPAIPLHVLVLATLCLAACERGGEPGAPERLARSSAALTATAVYDATLKAPKCGALASGCDTGTLVNGRATLGPESNAPNTLGGTCADGTSGGYHGDESLDRVQVYTNDGSNFAPGKTVTVSATVWAYSSYTGDKLDLYYAADATNPSWTFITTLTPAGAGVQTLTASYVLPSGGNTQAVRAAFRYGGTAAPCTTGGYDDRDDLAFLVISDTVPPTTAVTSPASGASVIGTLNLTASASDDQAVKKVEYYVDSTLVGSATAAPYTVAWNTLLTANGSHTLVSKAYDGAGNTATSAPITVTVNNPPDTVAPTVTLSGPANGAFLRGTLNLTASASDDRGVTTVEFYIDSTLVGSRTAAPYTLAWNTTTSSNGGHTVVAKAYDANGNVGTTAAVTVTVDNLAPTASVTSPAPSARIGGMVTLTANASDNQGVTKVEYFIHGNHMGTATAAPYTVTWNASTFTEGGASIVCKAYDAAGNVTTSALVSVYVDNTRPNVLVTNPTVGAIIRGNTTLSATAEDSVGLAKVEFYLDNVLLGSDTTAPYSLAWDSTQVSGGTHSLMGKAYDLAGNTQTSVMSFRVDNAVPTVALTYPTQGATVTGTVNLTVNATDDCCLTKVEYYLDNVLLGSTTTAPFTFAWNALRAANGSHTLVSKAYDAFGSVGSSAPVTVTVNNPPDTTPPVTSVTEPVNGAVVTGTSVYLRANASDNVDVTKVEFYVDDVLQGVSSGNASPYGIRWDSTSATNGSHTLVSKAYDAAGNVGTSSPVTLQVKNAPFATYDATRKAPRCGTLGIGCDTGSLVNGRALLGPESNAPNTLGGTCADGTSGTYHESESVDRIRVYTVDGGDFAPGKSIRVEVALWVPYNYTSDRLDLYYAADVNNPSWTLITTLTPGWAFAQTLTATYTLPTGGTVQAVRAALRTGGTAGACVSGVYNDRDDVVFAVNADTEPPTVAVTTPTEGSTVGGTVPLAVNTSDNFGVVKVEYYVGSILRSSVTSGGPTFPSSWGSLLAENGVYSVVAKAYDAAGNVGTSAPISITVFNDKTPPTATVTSPASGASFNGNVPLSATATDNVGVTSVTFLANDSFIGQVNAPPYAMTWNTATYSSGSHAIKVRACDAAGYCGTSAPISVILDRSSPYPVTISAGGTHVRGSVNLQASATDNVGVAKLEIYADGALLGSSTGSPYTVAWDSTAVANGSHTFEARAYDAAGNVRASSITATVDNIVPTTAVTSPTSGALLSGSVTLTATAADNLGVKNVQYFIGSTFIGVATAPPYTVTWDTRSAPRGNHVLTSRAYDQAGNAGISAGIPITVDQPPTVTVTNPLDGAYVTGTLNLTATATDDQGVTKVEYYVGGNLVGSATAPPYTVAWDTSSVGNGSQLLTARAYDTLGRIGSSSISIITRGIATAVYESALGAPRCSRAIGCDSGTLLEGRASSEQNTPNTLGGTCLDGTAGSYHVDESVERVKVYTSSGGYLTPGKTVTVEVSVWASNSYATDRLDLYYAANAQAPSWVYLTTLAPSSAGPQTLVSSYTLPFGGDVQAVRAAFRSGGMAESCGSGLYNDRDDLAFSVGTHLQPSALRVATGDSHSLALREDGTVWAWGNNYPGSLGDGTTTDRLSPVQVKGLAAVVALAAGSGLSVALREDGTVWTWGTNSSGQLGDGTFISRSTPVQVPGLTGITAISADGWHTLALRNDGTVWGWGGNFSGQLGDGTTTDRGSPVQVPGLTGVKAVSAGRYYSLALRDNGTVFAWGSNVAGAIGDGTTTTRLSPVQVPGLLDVTAISAGGHSLALRANGSLMAWGSNSGGQLGDGTTVDRYSPVQVPAFTPIKAIVAGAGYSLVLGVDGSLWTWGDNTRGELGTGASNPRSTPGQVPTQSPALALPSSTDHTALVVLSGGTGSYWSWGYNLSGQVGNGSTSQSVYTPIQVTIPAPPP